MFPLLFARPLQRFTSSKRYLLFRLLLLMFHCKRVILVRKIRIELEYQWSRSKRKLSDWARNWSMRCERCGKPATQIRDAYSYCDHCWTRRYGTIRTNGEAKHFLKALNEVLGNMGLSRQEGETMEQWTERCRASTIKCLLGTWHLSCRGIHSKRFRISARYQMTSCRINNWTQR